MSAVETTEHEDAVGTHVPDAAQAELDDLDDLDDVEETLVEEISIDGMCGVY